MLPVTAKEILLVDQLTTRLGLAADAELTLSRTRTGDLNVLVESLDTIYNVTLIAKAHEV